LRPWSAETRVETAETREGTRGCLLWRFGVEQLFVGVAIADSNSAQKRVAPCRLQFEQRIASLLVVNTKGKLAGIPERSDNSIPSEIRKGGGEPAARVQLGGSYSPTAKAAVRQAEKLTDPRRRVVHVDVEHLHILRDQSSHDAVKADGAERLRMQLDIPAVHIRQRVEDHRLDLITRTVENGLQFLHRVALVHRLDLELGCVTFRPRES